MTPDPPPPPQDLTDGTPEDVLKPEYLDAYQALHKDIWDRLTRVNTTISILETLHDFPFDHLYAPQENVFWTMVYFNFFGLSVLFLYSLVQDQTRGHGQPHTLSAFRDKLLTEWLDESCTPSFKANLASAKFNSKMKHIERKIGDLRNRLFAHRFVTPDGILSTHALPKLSLPQLRRYYEAVQKLFRATTFGTEHVANFYIGGTVGGKPVKKDIEQLLDLIVKDSHWLNEPEHNPDYWPAIRQYREKQEIEELNKWRARFNLPPA